MSLSLDSDWIFIVFKYGNWPSRECFYFILSIFLHSAYTRHVQFYRKDYTYIEDYDAFYKLHWDVDVAWNTAFITCDDEGATLFYPEAQEEWALVKNLTDKMTEVPNVTDIFVGLHDEYNLGEFITVDGHSTPYPLLADRTVLPHFENCIAMNIDTGKFKVKSCSAASNTQLPFVCKKVDDESCPTVDHGYKFLKSSKKCYKINKKPLKWQKAMKTCFMEGGILAVIENSAQAQEIKDILDQRETYFVGVKKLFSDADYYTVKGQKFNDMYQNPFNSGPNQHEYSDSGLDLNGFYPDDPALHRTVYRSTDCGTVSNQNNNNLYTETRDCDESLPFICEMEVGV